jgi:hypothetical protein
MSRVFRWSAASCRTSRRCDPLGGTCKWMLRSPITGGHTQDDAFFYVDGDAPVLARPQVAGIADLILTTLQAVWSVAAKT